MYSEVRTAVYPATRPLPYSRQIPPVALPTLTTRRSRPESVYTLTEIIFRPKTRHEAEQGLQQVSGGCIGPHVMCKFWVARLSQLLSSWLRPATK